MKKYSWLLLLCCFAGCSTNPVSSSERMPSSARNFSLTPAQITDTCEAMASPKALNRAQFIMKSIASDKGRSWMEYCVRTVTALSGHPGYPDKWTYVEIEQGFSSDEITISASHFRLPVVGEPFDASFPMDFRVEFDGGKIVQAFWKQP